MRVRKWFSEHFYDPFVQEANRQLREIVIQRRYINESILI